MLVTVIAEKEGNSVDGCESDSGVDDSGDECKIGTENRCYQVKAE